MASLSEIKNNINSEFDAIARTAALACQASSSAIDFIHKEHQTFSTRVNAPHNHRILSRTLLEIVEKTSSALFEFSDISTDPLFAASAFTSSHPQVRFVAGARLIGPDGMLAGVLCISDPQSKQLSDSQRKILSHLALTTEKALEYRSAFQTEIPSTDAPLAHELSFRALCELSPLGIFSTDIDGCCTYTNPQWQEIYGLNLKESLENGWLSGLHEDDRPQLLANLQQNAQQQSAFDFEYRIRHSSGEHRFVRARFKPLLDGKKSLIGFIGSVDDISEQKKIHQQNTVLLDTFRTQFILSITDTSGNIVEVNEAFCKISQYRRDELLGHNHRIIKSNLHSDTLFSELWLSIKKGGYWRGEICNRAKDGSHYWVDCIVTPFADQHGKIDRYISIQSDITLRKQQNQELRKHRALLDRIGSVAGVGGWEVDLTDNSLFWSEETYRIYGVEPDYQPRIDEAIRFYAPEAQPLIREAVEKAMKTGEGWDLELPFIQQSGKQIWVQAAGSAEFVDGVPVRILGAFQDVTERVNQRTLLEEAHSRMALATESGNIGIWEYDLKLGTLLWDERMYRLYGLSPANRAEPYEAWLKHLHPDEKVAVEKAVNDAIAGVTPFDIEFKIVWSDKSIHHIRSTARITRDASGAPLKMIGVNWDVSDLRRATEELSEQRELLEVTLESIGDAVITTDAQGNTTWLNPKAQQMTGWTNKDAKGKPLSDVFNIVSEETRRPIENPAKMCLSRGEIVGIAHDITLISRSGQEYGIEDSAAPIRNADGEVLGVVMVFHDVTEQRRLSNEISYQATHDALTGLLNRLAFEKHLQRLLEGVKSGTQQHALMYIDLDQFKIVNDTCGHSVGDEILQQVSKLLEGVIRSSDTLARLGGDEFGVILERCSKEHALRAAQAICSEMESSRFLHEGQRFRIGASVGLVAIDKRWSSTAALLQAADKSCYAAKDAGRNRIHLWSESDQAIRTRHGEMQWTTRIESALDDERFELYAQRLTNLKDDSAGIHAEVLVRMRGLDGKIILPGEFFPAAERFHLVSRIDRRVLDMTIGWLGLQSPATFAKIDMLCINLSGQSIGDCAFHHFATDIFKQAGQQACTKICLEITETAAITNLAEASSFIDQVGKLGVRVALDDFGAGASSFGYLKNLAVDILKIDGQFIQDLIDDPLDEAAVRCFVEVAKVVDLQTVAEFVDRPEILERVKELHIDYAQGFLLHHPEPISDAICSVIDNDQNNTSNNAAAKTETQ